MNHLMLDLETLATSPRAVVIQAGWCVFDPLGTGIVHGQQINVSVDSCVALGGEVDDGAVRFWLGQPDLSRASVGRVGIPVENALTVLDMDYRDAGCCAVWAHGSAFDVPIIEHYFRGAGRRPPWTYNATRDTRTLFWLAAERGWSRPASETAHTAMADAVAQAGDVQSALSWLSRPPAQ